MEEARVLKIEELGLREPSSMQLSYSPRKAGAKQAKIRRRSALGLDSTGRPLDPPRRGE